jgi:hypothetical protein
MNVFDIIDDDITLENWPNPSSGKLKKYIKRNYNREPSCSSIGQLLNDPSVGNFYKKRAIWYKNLYCKRRRKVKEADGVGACLTVFDIDDTLMKTTATVKVVRPDGSEQNLTAEEFNTYKLKPGEQFDFGEFKDAKLFRATSQPIKTLWRTAQTTLSNIGKRPGSRVVIVTARSDMDDKNEFIHTFQDHGLDMSKVHVYRAGNVGAGSSAANKKIIIRKLLESGDYTETRLFDDHIGNLESFLELKTEFPDIIFKAYPVGKSGNIGRPIIV